LHLQPVFQNLGYKTGDFPVAEKVANQCLSLPMSPYLNCDDQNKINKEILNLIR
jgi:UDP-2-acetamido-2-deoxy-ribo-hexuluronate aminotransferase